jgi:thioredoxin reductase (NADPH)
MTSATTKQIKDCIIIGGGPAGLTTAIYLARFRRNFILIDKGQSRAALIPLSHNYPEFYQGISGKQLLQNLRNQVVRYKGVIQEGDVISIEEDGKGGFILNTEQSELFAKNIILATGVCDIEPKLPNIEDAIKRGLVRHCPVCDGYEVIGQKIGVIGYGKRGLKEALFMRTYSNHITLFTLGHKIALSPHEISILNVSRINIITSPVTEVKIDNNKIVALISEKNVYCIDTLYSALGALVRSELAVQLNAKHVNMLSNCLLVNKHQQTTIPGLYATGDIVAGLNQICVATGQAAIAATTIHNKLMDSGA